ncbi:iron-sulfur cluster assembly protein [Leptothrix discophora]|uniref:Iron-sulfur cluster assembly protein n=1 Tax=Leptothrix discophora TaxID=89 RepID=A0ABT9G5R6_LEPDI|nr:iron-sulfur cluster assembly protein [Leptothrix discophora]MDP4301823.1 iron-sulfur cluster assembly protein [Leptothrix discophora]
MDTRGSTTIWIQPAPGPGAGQTSGGRTAPGGAEAEICGPCASLPSASWQGQGQPLLDGPPEQLAAVLAALRGVQEFREGRDIVTSGRVQALEIADGEATLTLRMGQGLCVDAHALAERAFEALRSTLPDTDLYLRHDRPVGCGGKVSTAG